MRLFTDFLTDFLRNEPQKVRREKPAPGNLRSQGLIPNIIFYGN